MWLPLYSAFSTVVTQLCTSCHLFYWPWGDGSLSQALRARQIKISEIDRLDPDLNRAPYRTRAGNHTDCAKTRTHSEIGMKSCGSKCLNESVHIFCLKFFPETQTDIIVCYLKSASMFTNAIISCPNRIDRSGWNVDAKTATSKIDAHLLLDTYKPAVWNQVIPLLRVLYGNLTDTVGWCLTYHDKFINSSLSSLVH